MYKNILFDFDGVILDSMPIRDKGFELVLHQYPAEQISQLIKFHRKNGGLSRYVKFRFFYEKVLKEKVTDEKIEELANAFSEIMRRELVNPDNLIKDSLNFIKNHYRHYNMHIVSGSEHKELNFLCEQLSIASYFISINGSPTPKTEIVSDLLKKFRYNAEETMLIGDSFNDYQAAKDNKILFCGYNNNTLTGLGNYLNTFADLISLLQP
jgi:HAD superfamily hydrolase (TIGR01549 family)